LPEDYSEDHDKPSLAALKTTFVKVESELESKRTKAARQIKLLSDLKVVLA
jgi:hypothetical protein